MRAPPLLAIGGLVTLLCGGLGCGSAPPPPVQPSAAAPDPVVGELDRLLARPAQVTTPGGMAACLRQVERGALCPLEELPPWRVIPVRVALDPRYHRWPAWRERLARTIACVNTFYQPTGLQWRVREVFDWDPGAQRHELYGLLDRLQRELPYDGRSVRLGISVWEERRIFASSGGEIGLSQYESCVVPSWPRIENDCVILTHELGHLAGAVHVPGKHWIMGWAASPFHLPAGDPLARVTAVYRFHPRNRAALLLARGAQFTPGGLALPEACAERLRQLDGCYGL